VRHREEGPDGWRWLSSRIRETSLPSCCGERRGAGRCGLAAFAIACGSSNNNKNNATKAASAAATAAGGAATAAGGTAAAGASGTKAAGTPGAAAATAAAPGKLGGQLNVGFTGPFAGVDPHNSVYGGAGIVPQVYDYLIRNSIIVPELGITPQLATKWELSADQLTTVFTLRPDAVIAQNTQNVPIRPMDAEDVKQSFDRVLDPKVASNGYSWASTWIDKYEAVDKTTFRLTTKKPYAWLTNNVGNNLESAIVPREWLASPDIKKTAVGSGPFILQSVEEGGQALFKKNPNYWDKGKPYIDTYSIRAFADQTTYRTAFSSGQLDAYGPTNVDEGKELQSAKKGTQFYTDPSFGFNSFWQNVKVKPWDDPRIRRAVWRAMNPQEYIQLIAHGDGVRIGLITYAMKQYALPDDEFNKLAPFDIQQSKQLLQAAGQPNLTFSFQHPTSSVVPDYVNIFVRQMQAAGITAKPEPSDAGTWVAGYFSNKLTASLSLNQEYSTPETPLLWYKTNGITGNNHYDTGFTDPEVDAAVDKAASTLDEQARIKAYYDAQRLIISKDPPFWNFFGSKAYAVVAPEIQNYPHGIGANLGYYQLRNIWLNR
jgi:peptide/nickel transport system substrate-binding protein